jgi:uncharacterized membrane protein YqiK
MAVFDSLSGGVLAVTLTVAIVLIVLLLILVLPGFSLVRADEVGVLTKKLSQGKIIVSEGEIGIQADILMPGLYWCFPIV